MNNQASTRYGIYLGLAVSVSLATGYVAGRLHEQIGNDNPATPTPLLDITESPDRDGSVQRIGLNPNPIRHTPKPDGRTIARHQTGQAEIRISAHPAGPRHLGEFADPDLLYQDETITPRHIGEFRDPDDTWLQDSVAAPVSIGDFKEPELSDGGI